jgi:hypothetical protein
MSPSETLPKELLKPGHTIVRRVKDTRLGFLRINSSLDRCSATTVKGVTQ